MDMLDIIFNRRSIRSYAGEKISRQQLELLVKAGMAAPVARNERHLYFMVVDDPALLKQMEEGLPNAKMLSPAGHAVVVMSDVSRSYGGRETAYWIQDCAAAAQNILIAVQALGLGACWTGVHPREERVLFLKECLHLPEEIVPLCVIAVGIPAQDGGAPHDKYDPDHVCWNEWTRRTQTSES